MKNRLSRRNFVKSTAAGLALPFAAPAILSAKSPNEKVRLAGIGVGGKGWVDITSAAGHADVLAFCDVDTGKNRRGGYGAAAEKWSGAEGYTDWRKLIDAEHKRLDGITVSTPDHMHAPITMTAMQLGLAVYTQKPLTRTVHEARALTRAAKKTGVATQMGNQHHSGSGYRTLAHWVQSGVIGKVKEAHTWSNRPIWPQGIDRPAGSDPIPRNLDWNLWLGVAKERPYKEGVYHPFKWRGWYDFGAGALGDMGCHIIDPVVWSLELGPPKSVSYEGPTPNPETFPTQEVLRYQFGATQYTVDQGCTVRWWDGGKLPPIKGSHLPGTAKLPSNGAMLIGEQATILCRHGGFPELYPGEKFATKKLRKVEAIDHYGVWVDAIRGDGQANSNFAYAGPLTETVLLGVIASRVGSGQLEWDAKNLRFTNSDEATKYVREEYREGWEVEGL